MEESLEDVKVLVQGKQSIYVLFGLFISGWVISIISALKLNFLWFLIGNFVEIIVVFVIFQVLSRAIKSLEVRK